jgi:hypothetical protein
MGSLGLGNGSLRMDDVFLEGATPDGPAVVGHLSVIVDNDGITFLGPEPGERRTVGWDRMSPLEFGPPAALPDGMPVTSLEFELDGRPLRLLVPPKIGRTGRAEPQATEAFAGVVLTDAPNQSGPTSVAAGSVAHSEPTVVHLSVPVAGGPASVIVESAAPVVEPPESVIVESAAPVVESPASLIVETPVQSVEGPASAIVESPLPVVEPPESVIVESPLPVVESPASVIVETPVQSVEGPASVIVESPLPIVEPPESVIVESPLPVVEPPASVIVETPVQSVEGPASVIVESPVPVVEPPASVIVESPVPVAPPPAPVIAESPVPSVGIPVSGDMAEDGSTTVPELEGPATDEDDWAPTQTWARLLPSALTSRAARRSSPLHSPRVRRLAVLAVVAVLVSVAAGLSYSRQPSAGSPASGLSDNAIALRVGIQPGDLPGWSSSAARMDNAFAAGANTHGAVGLGIAVQASTILARCLHVPASAVAGAFGMGNAVSQRTAQVASPSYADPSGNAGAASSVVDVVKTSQIQQADSNVFSDPALFATCYQPYVQAMLPFAAGGGVAGFATATVQPVVVPVASGPAPAKVAAFQIARIANEPGQTTTVITTAVAVYDGRVQATLGTVSNFVFPIDAQNQLVHDLEVRAIGVSRF